MQIDSSQFIYGLVGFWLGNVSGYLIHDMLKRSLGMTEDASKNFLLVTVTLLWAIAMVVDIISPSYDVPIAVHGILGAIVGFFFYRPKDK